MRKLWLLLALAFTLSSPAQAINYNDPNEDWIKILFGCSKYTCLIQKNLGGIVREYEWAADQALARDMRFIVEDECDSSCAIFASLVRKNACLMKTAAIGIHKGYNKRVYDPHGKL